MKSKKEIRLKICKLLDVCRECEIGPMYNEHPDKCSGCDIYTEMRTLGDMLAPRRNRFGEVYKEVDELRKIKISVEEYLELKKQGLKEKEIAEKLGVKPVSLSNWKYRNREKLLVAEKIKKAGAEKDTAKDQAEIMSEPVEVSGENSHEEIETEITALKKQLEALQHLPDVCSDLEEECARLRKRIDEIAEERDQALNAVRDLDYELENQKNKYESLIGLKEKLEKENKALKELVMLWVQ